MPKESKHNLIEKIDQNLRETVGRSVENLRWLSEHMHPYFFITMKEEAQALSTLALELQSLRRNRRLVLADRTDALILATLDRPGSVYRTLNTLHERKISYTEIINSEKTPPGLEHRLEIQTFKFKRKDMENIDRAAKVKIPAHILKGVQEKIVCTYPDFDLEKYQRYLEMLWWNDEEYVRISPHARIAQTLHLFHQCNQHGGVYFDIEDSNWPGFPGEYRVRYAAANPPQTGFLLQLMEAFNRLQIGIRRTYCLMITTGVHPYFLGTFYARARHPSKDRTKKAPLGALRSELENTQILSTESFTYDQFVTKKIMSGENAALVNAFVSFCHTTLAHSNPAVYELDSVIRAFESHPQIMLKLLKLFRLRFDPSTRNRKSRYKRAYGEAESAIRRHNTGHRHHDELDRKIFGCCLIFIKHTLKTNFFVQSKQALAFRLDPAYLNELDPAVVEDLPGDRPFRVTFFFSRFGCGYHIGFSDIARGGWRTILAKEKDDYALITDDIYKEVYVLAYTQHLKNKDIYEGGSKMAAVVDAEGMTEETLITQRMYKLQHGFINAFLDLFITDNGRVRDSAIVDYYGEDEPIELGPDENMHDGMVEEIARLSVKRGYILGSGIISSKKVGINHKEYGVTSTGVVTFAEISMKARGMDMRTAPFTVKMTGGPNGDVAGNAIRILIDRCSKVKINLILDGSGALFDPAGADRRELKRILFKGDIEAFRPSKLHKGGFILYRNIQNRDQLIKKFKRVSRTASGMKEKWVSMDDFQEEYEDLIFSTTADLFIPAGGRPETINEENADRFFDSEGTPTAEVIVEGANSFLTPEARDYLQNRGVVIMRDSSANKCGVISSSYEVIANLLLSDAEFLENKKQYVKDVIHILEKRASDEAKLIFSRYRDFDGTRLFTEISDDISGEINGHYERLFELFRRNPGLCDDNLMRKAVLGHLPRLIREKKKYRDRLGQIPPKYRYAILASEIASSLVYQSNSETDFIDLVRGHLRRVYSSKREEDSKS